MSYKSSYIKLEINVLLIINIEYNKSWHLLLPRKMTERKSYDEERLWKTVVTINNIMHGINIRSMQQ
jgi:hypothetical protein